MLKWLRNIVIILVALLIFVFFFAGKGIFDNILPIVQIKNAILLEVSPGDYAVRQMDDGNYIAKKDSQQDFIEYMVNEQGYALVKSKNDTYTFRKGNTEEAFKSSEFIGLFRIYEKQDADSGGDEKETATESAA